MLEHIKEDRAFLHDLANPLLVVSGQCSLLIRERQAGKATEASITERLDKILASAKRAGDLLQERRSQLIEMQKKLEPAKE